MVTLMFSGYAVGGMLAALLGKGLIETYGWQSVFIAAGVPVLLIPFILKSMPESMPFLIKASATTTICSDVRPDSIRPDMRLEPHEDFLAAAPKTRP